MANCPSCNAVVPEGAKFCAHCGLQIEIEEPKTTSRVVLSDKETSPTNYINANKLKEINQTLSIKNNQSSIVKKSLYAAALFLLVIIIAIMDIEILPIHPAIIMLSVFFFISAIIIGIMFRSREKKLQTLINGENVLASWTLSETEKSKYVDYLYQGEKGKNKMILWITSVLIVVIFGVFILVIDEGKVAMTAAMIGLLVIVSLFALGMPNYYKSKNMEGDGNVLIGKKFAYINGFFHNWDFPLSGIKKTEIVENPFYGLFIQYYYTDRTLTNTEELTIPAPKDVDLQIVLNEFNN